MPVKKAPARKAPKKRSARVVNTKVGTSKFKLTPKRSILLVLLIIAVGIIIKISFAATSWNLVYSEEFNCANGANSCGVDTSKWSIKTGTESHHQGHYLASNLSVHDGVLDILSQRNCVPSGGTPSASNAKTDGSVCPSGTNTVYSSGKVVSTTQWRNGRIVFRAKLPKTQDGLWSALWLRNKKASWGQTNYGELDTLEWYGDQQTKYTGTSIMGANAVKSQHFYNTGVDLGNDNAYHEYAMEWSTAGITYYFDNKPINRSNGGDGNALDVAGDFSGISAAQFQAIMDDNWEVRMETEITSQGNAWDRAPDNSKPWSPVHFLVDSVKVYTAGPALPPPPPPSANTAPTVSLTSPANGTTYASSPQALTISANASDADGIKNVEFFDGTTSIGVDTSSPYSVEFSAGTGSHTFTAKATDNNSSPLAATSSGSTITVNSTPPPASTTLAVPTGLTAVAGNGQVSLKWNAVNGATNYTVRWGTGGNYTNYSNSNGEQYSPTTSAYTVTGLTNGTTYNFSIRAKDSSGKLVSSNYSAGVNAAPKAPDTVSVLPAPSGFKRSYNFNSLTVGWNPVAGASGYNVSLNGQTPVRYGSNSLNTKAVTGTYDFKVWTINGTGQQSATPGTYSFTTKCILTYWCN